MFFLRSFTSCWVRSTAWMPLLHNGIRTDLWWQRRGFHRSLHHWFECTACLYFCRSCLPIVAAERPVRQVECRGYSYGYIGGCHPARHHSVIVRNRHVGGLLHSCRPSCEFVLSTGLVGLAARLLTNICP